MVSFLKCLIQPDKLGLQVLKKNLKIRLNVVRGQDLGEFRFFYHPFFKKRYIVSLEKYFFKIRYVMQKNWKE